FSATRTPQQNGVVERRNRTLVEAARTMLTFANLTSFLWAEAIATACFTENRSITHKHFDKTPYELMNKRKPNINFFHVFGCRCYPLNDYGDVRKLKAKGDIRVFVGYSKASAAFKIYNKRTRKIHESVNVNFDEISDMASKQFSLEPGLSNLNKTRKSSNPSVSQVLETLKKDLEDLFHNFYDVYFDSLKIMKSSTTNVETSINEEVFHEVFKSFQGEASSSSLNDDVQQCPEEVILPQTNTQLISNNMIPNVDEASTSHNVFNEHLEDAYFDASTSFHDPSNVHTFYQPYPHEKKWTKDHPLHKIIGDKKLSEEVYVGQPPGFVSKQYPNHVYDLDKALYGLKQAPRAWYDVLSQFLIDNVPTPMVEQAKLKLDLVGKQLIILIIEANPNEHHVSAVKRIFRYLKGIINLGIWYPKDSGFDLTAYSATDHAGCHLDRKSTSGSVQFLGDKLVCWSSKKKNCVSISIAKSEYVAVSSCCAQVLWMRTQITDYGFFYEKVPIYCDSKSAIAISCNPVQHTHTKQIDVRYHFIKDHVEKGTIELYFVGTEYQLADLFTKSLPEARFKFLVEKLGMMSRET
nr:retrovirus-related Pol polyprotein from transposon TNT 1-94 [Tanacetum cinerariifolium]